MTQASDTDLAWNAFLARRHLSCGPRRAALELSAERHSVDANALDVLIAVETLARPRLLQWLEFAVFVVLLAVNAARARTMTLGPAQIRVSHAASGSGRMLARVGLNLMRWECACERAAEILAGAPSDEIPDLCRWYNGPRCCNNYKALVLKLVGYSRPASV